MLQSYPPPAPPWPSVSSRRFARRAHRPFQGIRTCSFPRFARELGHPDYFALEVAAYGMTTEEMVRMQEDFMRELRPLFLQLHTWAKYKLAEGTAERVHAAATELLAANPLYPGLTL